MQNRTIILIDAIALIVLSVFLAVLNLTAYFTFAMVFSDTLDEIELIAPFVLVPFAISVLLANFGHSLSAKITTGVGFAILAIVLINLTMFFIENDESYL